MPRITSHLSQVTMMYRSWSTISPSVCLPQRGQIDEGIGRGAPRGRDKALRLGAARGTTGALQTFKGGEGLPRMMPPRPAKESNKKPAPAPKARAKSAGAPHAAKPAAAAAKRGLPESVMVKRTAEIDPAHPIASGTSAPCRAIWVAAAREARDGGKVVIDLVGEGR